MIQIIDVSLIVALRVNSKTAFWILKFGWWCKVFSFLVEHNSSIVKKDPNTIDINDATLHTWAFDLALPQTKEVFSDVTV